MVKNLPAMKGTWVQSLGWENPLEKEMTTHFSILAWKIPWTEEPGRLHNRLTNTGGLVVKNLPDNIGGPGSIPGLGRSLKKGMATHSSILAWEMPWTGKSHIRLSN